MTDRVSLPVVSSAAATDFVHVSIEGPDGVVLHIDGNQKISGWANPIPNAFSLVQIEDCPGSTPTCRSSCYVAGLEAAAKSIHDLYRHNSKTIRMIIGSPHASMWAILVAEYITEKCQISGFRWHVSGDLFSAEYTGWVAEVVARSPDVQHWIYTRSFMFTAAFVGLENITINYSVDRDNYEHALPFVAAHAGVDSSVRLAYLVTDDGAVPSDLPPGSVLFPDYSLRGTRGEIPSIQRESSAWYRGLTPAQRRMVCPTDFYGKSPVRVCGPCTKCILPPSL